jgi:hypothetical protein
MSRTPMMTVLVLLGSAGLALAQGGGGRGGGAGGAAGGGGPGTAGAETRSSTANSSAPGVPNTVSAGTGQQSSHGTPSGAANRGC